MKLIEKVDTGHKLSETEMADNLEAAPNVSTSNAPETNSGKNFIRMAGNKLTALLLILLLLPAFLLVIVLIKILDPGPIFYSGARLGYRKKIFYMFKFRTLPTGAQEKIGAEVFSSKHDRPTPLGYFLRETRLDELPQLLNVLLGDMVFVGPRPVRPEIYHKLHDEIPRYDMRFLLRPGLVGYTQLLTPHGTPKRIRAYINNCLYFRRENIFGDLQLISYGAWALIRNMVGKTIRLIEEEVIDTRLLNRYQEKRFQHRIKYKQARVSCASLTDTEKTCAADHGFRNAAYGASGLLRDINESHARIWTDEELTDTQYLFRFEQTISNRGGIKFKRAYCKGHVFRKIHPLQEAVSNMNM